MVHSTMARPEPRRPSRPTIAKRVGRHQHLERREHGGPRKGPFARDIDDPEVQAHALVPRLVLAGQAGLYERAFGDLEPLGRRPRQHHLMQTRGSPLEPLEQGIVLTRGDQLGGQDHRSGLARQFQGSRQGAGARAHERHLGAGTHAPKPYGGVVPAAERLELAILGVLRERGEHAGDEPVFEPEEHEQWGQDRDPPGFWLSSLTKSRRQSR